MMSNQLKNTLNTLTLLWSQTSLLFSSCIEVNFYREKFNTHIANYDKSITLDKVVISGLLNYNLIVICSFLDEWNNEFNPIKIPEYSERILKIKTYTKPIFKRINKWTGLKNYRNVVLAHNLRAKGGHSIFESSQFNYNIPHDPTEMLLLSSLINLAMINTINEFKEISFDVEKAIRNFFQSNKEKIDTEGELAQIRKELEILKNDN